MAFSPDGKRIVTGSGDQTVKVWDAETGQKLALKGHTHVSSVAFSPDGKRIVTGSGARTQIDVRVWDAETGTEKLTLKGHTSPVTSVAFSPDGKRIVTGSEDQTAQVWDADTGTEKLALRQSLANLFRPMLRGEEQTCRQRRTACFRPDRRDTSTSPLATRLWAEARPATRNSATPADRPSTG